MLFAKEESAAEAARFGWRLFRGMNAPAPSVRSKGNGKSKDNGKSTRRSFDSRWSLRMTAFCFVKSGFPEEMTARKATAGLQD